MVSALIFFFVNIIKSDMAKSKQANKKKRQLGIYYLMKCPHVHCPSNTQSCRYDHICGHSSVQGVTIFWARLLSPSTVSVPIHPPGTPLTPMRTLDSYVTCKRGRSFRGTNILGCNGRRWWMSSLWYTRI